MKKLEVYFDYLCPYCLEGHLNLKKLMPSHPDVEIVWCPCEAHPRPEEADIYSDIAIMGMYYLRDRGLNVEKYNDLVFLAHFDRRVRIDDPEILAEIAAACGAGAEDFKAALADRRYAQAVLDANQKAWGEKGWEAVPSYSCSGEDIGSRGGVLVPEEELDIFLKEA